MLETLFYSLGVISMSVFLVIVITIILIIAKIRSDIVAFKKGFVSQAFSLLKGRNVEVASALGLTVVHFIFDKMRKSVDKRRKSV